MDPANVSPFVAYLATADCPIKGRIFYVAGGGIHLFQPFAIIDSIAKDGRWTVGELADRGRPPRRRAASTSAAHPSSSGDVRSGLTRVGSVNGMISFSREDACQLRSRTRPGGSAGARPEDGELIASHLRGQIVRGELATGETLPSEGALMETFSVSRPTLREAFRILETESLINVRRGARGGARVVAPDVAVAARYVGLLLQVTRTTIADVYEARMVIEPAAAGLLASRRTRKDLDDLNGCIDRPGGPGGERRGVRRPPRPGCGPPSGSVT